MAGPDVSAGPLHILSAAGPGLSQPGPDQGPGPGPGLGSSPGTGLAGPRGRWLVSGPMYQTTCCCCCPLDKLMERKQGRNVHAH